MNSIELKNVTKRLKGNTVLDDITLDICDDWTQNPMSL